MKTLALLALLLVGCAAEAPAPSVPATPAGFAAFPGPAETQDAPPQLALLQSGGTSITISGIGSGAVPAAAMNGTYFRPFSFPLVQESWAEVGRDAAGNLEIPVPCGGIFPHGALLYFCDGSDEVTVILTLSVGVGRAYRAVWTGAHQATYSNYSLPLVSEQSNVSPLSSPSCVLNSQ